MVPWRRFHILQNSHPLGQYFCLSGDLSSTMPRVEVRVGFHLTGTMVTCISSFWSNNASKKCQKADIFNDENILEFSVLVWFTIFCMGILHEHFIYSSINAEISLVKSLEQTADEQDKETDRISILQAMEYHKKELLR